MDVDKAEAEASPALQSTGLSPGMRSLTPDSNQPGGMSICAESRPASTEETMRTQAALQWASDDDDDDLSKEVEFQAARKQKMGYFPSPPVSPTMARVLSGSPMRSPLKVGREEVLFILIAY